MILLSVAVPAPLRSTFDYFPTDENVVIDCGQRVEVEFGHRKLIGMVIERHQSPSLAVNKIKRISRLIDDSPIAPTSFVNFCRWAAQYYQHPIGEVIFAALPKSIREGKTVQKPWHWIHTTEGLGLPYSGLKRAKKQQRVHQYLLDHLTITLSQAQSLDVSKSVMQAMEDKNIIKRVINDDNHQSSQQTESLTSLLKEPPLELSTEQRNAVESVKSHKYSCTLLYGVTGSGKTEVYLHLIQRTVMMGQQVLILVPEIGLAPQTLNRIEQRFACPVAQLNSEISDGQRTEYWLNARDGKAAIIIGTRLASLAPVKNLGLIIIDEEHDTSYKQQDSFKYSARDMCIYRARQLDIPIVLGSATPSLESFRNVQLEKFHYAKLTQRAAKATPPQLEVADLRNVELTAGLAKPSLEALQATLSQGQQALVFINRRGYAPTFQCRNCGWISHCDHCDSHMTLHKSPLHLRCHHCDRQQQVPRQCPNCRSHQLVSHGIGTEQTEEYLLHHFANVPVIRVDKDSTRTKSGLEKKLNAARQGDPCILIGTQMLAKGHHLPNLTLVLIVNADQGLLSADFRGTERMGQLITQVSGRSGREANRGKVIIQSYCPDHPILQLLISKEYHYFAFQQLREREQAKLPPFAHMVNIRSESKRPDLPIEFLKQIKTIFKQNQKGNIDILGPIPDLIEKVNGRFRFNLQLTSDSRPLLHDLIQRSLPQIEQSNLAKRTRWNLDIDPQ